MRPHEVNNLNYFIEGWYFDNLSICDSLVEYHQNCHLKYEGIVANNIVNKNFKDSIDCKITDYGLLDAYFKELQKVTKLYIEKYFFVNGGSAWCIDETPNLQMYPPGGGFHKWHFERTHASDPVVRRHMVYMTYLNDVVEGGETEFFYQHVKIKPEKGLTVLWPADWTFTHRGIASLTQTKYIITGWYSLVKQEV
jgi:prolyl 4-hydroxylase